MILQVVGKVEGYRKIWYEIEENGKVFRHETFLSSEALKKFYESKGISESILLFAPQSIVEEYGGLDKLEGEIKKRDLEDFELVVFPSIGEYRFGEKSVRYKMRFDDVVVSMFLELLKRRPEKVVLDISTGQNVYVSALIEAARRYATYRSLEGILQGGGVSVKIATYQPIIKGVDSVKVEIGEEFSPRVFFSLPEVNIDKLPREVKGDQKAVEISKKYSGQKSDFRKMQKELVIAFNSMRYSVPLAFYELLSFDADAEGIESSIMSMVEEFVKNEVSVSLKEVSNALFSIAMFKSFREFKSQLLEPCIDEIKEKFSNAYKNIGVNTIFLEHELRDISSALENQETRMLKDLHESKGSRDVKRNFFAHCGFLKEYTMVTRKGGKICITWIEDKREEIKEWLLKPEPM